MKALPPSALLPLGDDDDEEEEEVVEMGHTSGIESFEEQKVDVDGTTYISPTTTITTTMMPAPYINLPYALRVHVPGAVSTTAYGAAMAASMLACLYNLKLKTNMAVTGEINKAGDLLYSVKYQPSIVNFLSSCGIETLVVGDMNDIDLDDPDGNGPDVLQGTANVVGVVTYMLDEEATKDEDSELFFGTSPM